MSKFNLHSNGDQMASQQDLDPKLGLPVGNQILIRTSETACMVITISEIMCVYTMIIVSS